MKVIGIDLGTSNSYIYVSTGDSHSSASLPAPLILPRISDDAGSIATVVLYENDQPILAGNIAESEFYANVEKRGKRRLRSQFKPELAQGTPDAMRAMTDFLRIVRKALPEDTLEEDVRLYVGMPSLARQDFSVNLSSCFQNAGWPKPSFLRESDAAMISCLQSGSLNIEDVEHKCLILDFGGGTCDYTLVAGMEALRNGGDLLYGGRLFDDLFFQAFCRANPRFAKEAPKSPFAWYLHWIECKQRKEQFSDYLADHREDDARLSLHAVWYDTKGERHDTFLPDYSRADFIRDAENYHASPEMLDILAQYRERGGLSPEARDLLGERRIGLISWLGNILAGIERRSEVARVVLTGGSSRWFFTSNLAAEYFPNAVCAPSKRGFEDIAFGLALYPALCASRDQAKKLLERKLETFTVYAVKKALALARKNVEEVIRFCSDRIIERDVLPVLEAAQKESMTVAEAEKRLASNIREDKGLLAIVEERGQALGKEIQDELALSFRRWLKENGVLLTPAFVFPTQAISQDFLNGLSERLSSLDVIKMAALIMATISGALAGLTVGGAILHTGEPVSTVIGGFLAGGGTWLAARVAPQILNKFKLPRFMLTDKIRQKIVSANRAEIEKSLTREFEKARKNMAVDIERRLGNSLASMVGQLGILNQIESR